MKKEIKKLTIIAVLWIIFEIIGYYLIWPLFLIPLFFWLGFSAVFLIITVYQLIKLIIEWKNNKTMRIIKTLFYGLFFYLTFDFHLTGSMMEKVDWYFLYPKRMEIVEQVQKMELNPNVSWNDYLCELPFEFPIVSKSGNDITIRRNDSTQAITVGFYIDRGLLSSSTFFIYTNDDKNIQLFDSMTKEDLINNWKLKDNWYRIRE
jgi:hypothetical protein